MPVCLSSLPLVGCIPSPILNTPIFFFSPFSDSEQILLTPPSRFLDPLNLFSLPPFPKGSLNSVSKPRLLWMGPKMGTVFLQFCHSTFDVRTPQSGSPIGPSTLSPRNSCGSCPVHFLTLFRFLSPFIENSQALN